MQKENTGEQLRPEIERRIAEMESGDYRFPQRFTRRDYIAVAAVAAVCLLCILAGAWL